MITSLSNSRIHLSKWLLRKSYNTLFMPYLAKQHQQISLEQYLRPATPVFSGIVTAARASFSNRDRVGFS
jgi:hypothetical protein